MRARSAGLLWIALCCLVSGAATGAGTATAPVRSPEERAILDLEQRLQGCMDATSCSERLVRIALLDPAVDPGVRKLCFQRIEVDTLHAKDALVRVFAGGTPALQVEVLGLLDRGWNTLFAGTDSELTTLTVSGLESPSKEVRRAAARFMAHRQLPMIAHSAVDAAEDEPEWTLAALLAIDNDRDEHEARWVIRQLTNPRPAVRQEAQRVIARLGRSAVPFLRERLDDKDRHVRAAVAEAWLFVVMPDDQALLESWLKDHGAEDRHVAEKISAVLAQVLAGTYEPRMPPRPPLDF